MPESGISAYKVSGIVGARRCTDNGKQASIAIAYVEVKKGAVIISGMASTYVIRKNMKDCMKR